MAAADLRRSLRLLDATTINLGTMLASGIFITSASIARGIEGSVLHLAVWVVAGLFSVLGALAIAELGAMMPEAGGIYVYLERAFGPLWGFLYGWALFLAIQNGAIAAVAVATATYVGWFVPLSENGVRLVAIASIAGLTGVNVRGVTAGATVQNVLTIVKVAAVVILVAIACASGDAANLRPYGPEGPWTSMLGPLGLAMVAALWCYDGWIHLSYIAGEVRDPDRTIPRAALLSTLGCIALYLALNLAYFLVLGAKGMARSDLVASETARLSIGPAGAGLVAALVAVSCLGANNGFILSGARVYYAMARDGLFFRRLASVSPATAVPAASLVVQGIWSCLLVFSGRYDQIFTYVIFVEFLFYALAAWAVVVLRRREPDARRPYRVWGYPWTLILFIAFSAALLANTIWSAPREAAIGLAAMIRGVPVFWYWDRKRRRAARRPTGSSG